MKSNENIAIHHVNDCVVLPLLYLLATQVSTYRTPHKHTYLPGGSTLTPPICPSQCSNEKNAGIAFPLDLFTQAIYNVHMKIIAATQIQILLASNNNIISLSDLLATQVGTYQTPPNHTYLLGHCNVQMKKNTHITFPLGLLTQGTWNAKMKILAVTQI